MRYKTIPLGKVANITKLAGFEFTKYISYDDTGEIIALRALNLRDGELDLSDVKRIKKSTSESLERSKLYENDILLTYTGNGYGDCAIITESNKYHLAPNICKISPFPKLIYPYFLYSYIRSKIFYSQMTNHMVGSSQPTIPMKTIRLLEVPLPPLEIQKKIVDVLYSLDEKVRLNKQINKNLEWQAQALYIAMFVDNLELSTTLGTLSDIATITMGQSPNGSSYNEKGVGEVFYQGRAEFGFRFPTRRLYTTEPKRFAEAGDVLLSVRAPVGDLNVAYERCCIGRGLGAVHSKSDNSSFILYTMRALKPQLDVFNGEGTVFGSINRDALSSIPLNIPSPEAITRFESIVQPIDELIRVNYEEICYLQTLRDTLLPKLMAGQIDVKDVNL